MELEKENSSKEATNLEKNRRLFWKYITFFAVVFLVVGSYFIGVRQGEKKTESEKTVPLSQSMVGNKMPGVNENIDFSLFWKVWDLVKEKHVDKDKIDAQKMLYGAINGFLKSTGDPYSTFFDPTESKSFNEEIEGSFDGIGAELGMKDDILTIIAPLDGSPSQKAGLRAGDKILKIDGKITTDLTIYQAVDLIRGKKGTSVTLTILHQGEQETKDIAVTRDTIEVKSVKLEMKDDKIAQVKITKFGDNTAKEFDNAVSQMTSSGTKGMIIDLRNNPGGLLDKAVDIASRMIPKGKVVVTEEDSAGNKESLKTEGGDRLSSMPTV
ncbi:MAG TPA: S41 family peptidase, partial [Patescibacteria group bacterium]|nr:S41 family peptidase [Patescibacteria group bacterium]